MRDFIVAQNRQHAVEMRFTFLAEIIDALGRRFRDLNVLLAIEQPQRISLEPFVTIFAQLCQVSASVLEYSLTIRGPALLVSK